MMASFRRAAPRARRAARTAAPYLVALALAAPIAAQQSAQPESGALAALTLQQAVALAQRQGFDARAAADAVDAVRWRDRAFDARLRPQLSASGTLPSINRAIIPVLRPDGTTTFAAQSQMTSSVGLTLSQQVPLTGGRIFVSSGLTRVDLYGREDSRLWQSTPVVVGIQQSILRPNTLAWDARVQDVRADVAERQYLEAREDVALAAADAFFDLYAAEMAVANAESNAAVNDTLYVLNKGRYEVGKIAENDLLQSELALLRARTALDGARLDRDRAAAALRLRVNAPDDVPLAITPPTGIPSFDPDPEVAVAQALRNRSQMRDLDLQELVARRQLAEAKRNTGFGMQLTAMAGFNQTASVFGDAYQSMRDQQQLELGLEMPLVQWGARHAQIEAARAEQRRVGSVARAGRAAAEHEARFAALQLVQARRQLALSAKADTVAAKRFEVAKNRYIVGKIDIGALYIAQSEKDAALLSFVQALRGYWTAHYRLRRLTLYDFETRRSLVP